MTPGDYPLMLYRGDTYHWQFTLWADEAKTIEADLTGATAKAEIRDEPSGATIIEMVCAITLPNLIDMKLLAAQSKLLMVEPQQGVWDLQLTWTSSGDVATVLRGAVIVEADVTDSTIGGLGGGGLMVVRAVRGGLTG